MNTPIFVVSGLLESGKTTLIKNMFRSPEFRNNGPTLLIVCEDGEEEYDREFLTSCNVHKVTVEECEKFTPSLLQNYEALYRPRQIIIEYNGTWKMDMLLDTKLPLGWEIASVYSVVNCESAELYMLNMRAMFMEPLGLSSLIIFNRYEDGMDRAKLRRNIKALNPMAQIVFERVDGSVVEETSEDLPFDINADVIEVKDEDYGIWFIDTLDNPGHYIGKKVKFKAQVYTDKSLPMKTFVPGRFAMTCCADDIQFLGHECRYFKNKLGFNSRDWVDVWVRVEYEFNPQYGEDIPILYLEKIKGASKPSDELVYFI
ncbi:GTP-binding protein [Anaerofustis sp.]|uniref:TIGR03943 family putative permease subunit n=1 Tax=Anaerofustis sp. TaxID=1872517 RepID=UPI0025BF9C2F|nr:GTP-binding protein [Anaerofustis sp.]